MHHGARILIVDDIEENVEVLTRLLERAGYEQIWSTNDPKDAATMARQVSPHLIILDLDMPEIGGLEVMASIHGTAEPKERIPVLILTGTANAEAEWMSLASGARDFVRKPFHRGELLLRVRNLTETGTGGPQPHDVPTSPAWGEPDERSSSAAHVRRVAHDLNNLLTQICGYADLLQLEIHNDSSASADVAEVQRAARDASSLTAELLAYGLTSRSKS